MTTAAKYTDTGTRIANTAAAIAALCGSFLEACDGYLRGPPHDHSGIRAAQAVAPDPFRPQLTRAGSNLAERL